MIKLRLTYQQAWEVEGVMDIGPDEPGHWLNDANWFSDNEYGRTTHTHPNQKSYTWSVPVKQAWFVYKALDSRAGIYESDALFGGYDRDKAAWARHLRSGMEKVWRSISGASLEGSRTPEATKRKEGHEEPK